MNLRLNILVFSTLFFIATSCLKSDEEKHKIRAWQVEPAVFKGTDESEKQLIFTFSRTVPFNQQVTVMKKVNKDGLETEIPETRTITAYQNIQEMRSYPKSSAKVYSADHKELQGKARDTVLKKETVVLFAQGDEIDPRWAALLKPESLIVLVPLPSSAMPYLENPAPRNNRPANIQPVPGIPRTAPTIPIPPCGSN